MCSLKSHLSIPEKATWVLQIILVVLVFYAIRSWHLTVVQHEQRKQLAQRPQKRLIIEPAQRGTIRDRFNFPLAVNTIQYNAAVSYSQLLEIQRVAWKYNEQGKKIRYNPRKEHITVLSEKLADLLSLDPSDVEDLIYSQAAIFPGVPYIIKSNIGEKEYHRLKILEKDYPGIVAQIVPRRTYPRGRLGCELLGYLGSISRSRFDSITDEITQLKEQLEQSAREDGDEMAYDLKVRLADLEEKAYDINDFVGKSGIEKTFEEHLRGFYGKKSYSVDALGHFLKKLPGEKKPLPGKRIVLTISSELQEFAEKLLIQSERIRDHTSRRIDKRTGESILLKQPWIKGGAIVALDPNSGEVLALASYPRYNPNDFVPSNDSERDYEKQQNIGRWLESEAYIADLWDQKMPLQREFLQNLAEDSSEEERWLTWDLYLSHILPEKSPVRYALDKRIETLGNAVYLQNCFEALLQASETSNARTLMDVLYPDSAHEPFHWISQVKKLEVERRLKEGGADIDNLKQILDQYIGTLPTNYEKLLTIDLCRVAVDGRGFTAELLQVVEGQSISLHREVVAAYGQICPVVEREVRKLFHQHDFARWRHTEMKKFLKEKRKQEKEEKKYARPYLEYLTAEENAQFDALWTRWGKDFVALMLAPQGETYFATHPSLRFYKEHLLKLAEKLKKENVEKLAWKRDWELLGFALKPLTPPLLLEYLGKLRRYSELTRPLLGRYHFLRRNGNEQLEKHLAAGFYPRYGFGYGRSFAFRQAAPQGSLFKIVTAYAALLQKYHEIAGKWHTLDDLNPLTIVDQAYRDWKTPGGWIVGFKKDGSPIPAFYKGGRILKTLRKNVGEVDLLRALEVSSNTYFALLTGDYMKSPRQLNEAAYSLSYGHPTGIDLPSEYSGHLPGDIEENRSGLYSYACGQHTLSVTALQTAVMLSAIANGGTVFKPKLIKLTAGKDPIRTTSASSSTAKDYLDLYPVEIKNKVEMPEGVRLLLLKGMQRVMMSKNETSMHLYQKHPEILRDYTALRKELVGKSSTAEAFERVDLDPLLGSSIYNHCWFGCISFKKSSKVTAASPEFSTPELVVVVFLRYSDYGKEVAPLAVQVIKKWREIQQRWE